MRKAIFFLSRSFSNGSKAISEPHHSDLTYQSPRERATRRVFAIATAIMVSLLSQPCNAISLGCWWNSTPLPKSLSETCDFYLVKQGIFSHSGSLQKVKAPASPYIWITHRLSRGEKLTAEQAVRLAKDLNALSKSGTKKVEIDVEPLTDLDSLALFLKALREKLSPELSLRLATPFFSTQKWPGHSWKEADFAKIITLVNGIDLMVYDTGAKTADEYRAIVEENLLAALRWMEKNQSLEVMIGLPAYPDKTKLHKVDFENVEVAKSVLIKNRSLRPDRLTLGAYAGWTMSPKEALAFKSLKETFQ